VGEKREVVVKVGAESEMAMCDNAKWWSKWAQNLKWPCSQMESGGQNWCGI
jgi:hypothetical protein